MMRVETQRDGTCNILGCADPITANYLADANQDDGSCVSISFMDVWIHQLLIMTVQLLLNQVKCR